MHRGTTGDFEIGEVLRRTGRFFAMGLIAATILAMPCLGQSGRRVVSNPSPEYPALAKNLNLKGTVKIEVLIASGGEIRDARVIGGHPILVDASLAALKKWKYAAGIGESKEIVTFRF